jgi:preprotein translocase subunit SecG
MPTFFLYTAVILLLLTCCFLILLVLIQKGRGGGLASAFGGGGGNTAFGSKTGDVLTWATSIVFAIFLLLSIGANLAAESVHKSRTTGIAPAAQTPSGSSSGAPSAEPSNPLAGQPASPSSQPSQSNP